MTREQNLDLDEAVKRMAQKLGTTGSGRPEDVARAVAFLASSPYVQGALDVDGGQTPTL